MIDLVIGEQAKVVPSIKVVGVGGAGGNTINSLMASGCQGIFCLAANTDAQALDQSLAQQKIQIGVKTTKGLGTGANPEIGKHAAEEDLDKIMESLSSADIVFLTAGMGGGTGSGALPVIAQALKREDILTIALVTTPFTFEGCRRAATSNQSLEKIKKEVDALIVLPNQRLLDMAEQDTSLLNSFAMVNEMLNQSIKSIADIVSKPGYINVDFADLKAIMKGMGLAVMGTGKACGQNRAIDAAMQAISAPLLENMTISGAHGVLLNITAGPALKLNEINQAATIIHEQAAEQAQIIVGAVIDDALDDELLVTIIATGFEKNERRQDCQNVHTADVQQQGLAPAIMSNGVDNHHTEKMLSKRCQERCIQQSREACTQQEKKSDLVESSDLDVPTFMRKQAEDQNS